MNFDILAPLKFLLPITCIRYIRYKKRTTLSRTPRPYTHLIEPASDTACDRSRHHVCPPV